MLHSLLEPIERDLDLAKRQILSHAGDDVVKCTHDVEPDQCAP